MITKGLYAGVKEGDPVFSARNDAQVAIVSRCADEFVSFFPTGGHPYQGDLYLLAAHPDTGVWRRIDVLDEMPVRRVGMADRLVPQAGSPVSEACAVRAVRPDRDKAEPISFNTTVEERDFYKEQYGAAVDKWNAVLDQVITLSTHLAVIASAADRVLDCLNEFAPEYPQACAEWCDALDAVLAEAESDGSIQRKGAP